MEGYKSLEQKIGKHLLKVTGPIEKLGKFTLKNFGKGFYDVYTTPLRIPTSLRKYCNRQFSIQRENVQREKEDSKITSKDVWRGTLYMFGGFTGGISSFGSLLFPIIHLLPGGFDEYRYAEPDYTPLIIEALILSAINLFSGGYETGRFPKSKEEYQNLEWLREKEDERPEAICI